MERVAVRSTEIAIVGYEASSKTLEVAFRNGSVYHYEQVPPEMFQQFIKADSIGLYFADKIKTAFPYTKIH